MTYKILVKGEVLVFLYELRIRYKYTNVQISKDVIPDSRLSKPGTGGQAISK
jgi:hypothetical protein